MKGTVLIERYLQALETSFEAGQGGGHWPGNGAQIQGSFSDIAALDFYNLLHQLLEKYTLREIAEKVPAYAVLFPLRQAGIIGLKVIRKYQPAKISQDDIVGFFLKLVELARYKVFSGPFCSDGKYLILDKEEVRRICQHLNWQVPKQRRIEEIALLSTTLESYSWSFFYDLHRSTGYEIHGPYDVSEFFGRKMSLLIKDGHDLAPNAIWPKKYPYKSVILYLVYQDAGITIDFLNRQFSLEPIKEKLKYFSLVVNGKEQGVKRVSEPDRRLEELAVEQARHVDLLRPLEVIKKGAEIYYFSLRPFYELARQNWRPPPEAYKQVEELGERLWTKGAKREPKHRGKFYRRLFDPRDDFYGE